MKRSLLLVFLAVVLVGGGGLAWVWLSGGSGEPSTELTTPDIESRSSTTAGPVDEVAFVIDAARSRATFTLDEVLRGTPNTVVGTTSEIAGQFTFDPNDLASSSFSAIIVNARTLTTDSSIRDRVIRGPVILNSASDEFELITFEITSIAGLNGSASVGDEVTFELVGDLSIKGTTNQVMFQVTATYSDPDNITGRASATVLRSDFGIDIPNVASVAGVTDEVTISLDFVATRS